MNSWRTVLKKSLMTASTFLSAVPAKAWWSTDMLKEGYESGKAAVKSSVSAGYNTMKGASHLLQGFNHFISLEQRRKVIEEGSSKLFQAAKDSLEAVGFTASSLLNFVSGSVLQAQDTLAYVKALGDLTTKYDYVGRFAPVVDAVNQATDAIKGMAEDMNQGVVGQGANYLREKVPDTLRKYRIPLKKRQGV